MVMMELYLIRYGQSVGNVSNMIQGSADLDLTDEGRRQAELVALRLKDVHLDVLYTSPMKRARATAEAIANGRKVEIMVADWLKEMDTGDLSGMSRDEIERRYPGFFQIPPVERNGWPGGETNTQFSG